MHVRSGFSLIEFLIATAIAAFLASFLFAIVQQTNRTTRSIDAVTDLQLKAMLLQRQLERDLSGVCIPFTALEQLNPEKKQEKKTDTRVPQQSEKEQKKAPKIEKIFYATTKEKQSGLLTCITNNPLPTAAWLTGATPAPALARVVYRLKEEKSLRNKMPTYTLWWQESSDLSFEAFNEGGTIREYELVSGIVEFACTFVTLKKENENKNKKDFEVVKNSDWDVEKKEKNTQKEQEQERPVPHSVEIKVTFADAGMKRTETFNFTIPILPDFMMSVPQVKEEQPEAAKTPMPNAQVKQQKPPQSPGSTGSMFDSAGLQVPASLQPKTWNQATTPSSPTSR